MLTNGRVSSAIGFWTLDFKARLLTPTKVHSMFQRHYISSMGINTMWLVLTPQCGARSMGAEAPLSFWDSPYVSKKQRGRCLPLEVKFQQIKFWTQTYLKPQLQSYWVNKNAVCSVVVIQYVTWVINEIIQNLRSVFSHDLQCSRNGSHEYIKVASHTLVIWYHCLITGLHDWLNINVSNKMYTLQLYYWPPTHSGNITYGCSCTPVIQTDCYVH